MLGMHQNFAFFLSCRLKNFLEPAVFCHLDSFSFVERQGKIPKVHAKQKGFKNFFRGALCVEMGFTWTFSRNQDAKVKLKSELIFIKSAPSLFKIIYSVSGYPKCPTSVLSSLWQRRPQQYPVTKPTTNAATAPALTVIIKVSRENSAWEASIT